MSDLLIVGAGAMAKQYVHVARYLELDFDIVCRSRQSAETMAREQGVRVTHGGLDAYLASHSVPRMAVVAVAVPDLARVTRQLIVSRVSRVLVEKPGALNRIELQRVAEEADTYHAEVWLAYNRRFYQSTLAAKRLVAADGGLTSLSFDFSEWSEKVADAAFDPQVKEAWVAANSSHVLDLAFYFGGTPIEFSCWTAGSLDWHQSAARFAGAGMTADGVPFSYLSGWEAPGRWRLELCTPKRRLLMSPLEQLKELKRGSPEFTAITIDDSIDQTFKPGLVQQVSSFVDGQTSEFCSVADQVANFGLYATIAGYRATRSSTPTDNGLYGAV